MPFSYSKNRRARLPTRAGAPPAPSCSPCSSPASSSSPPPAPLSRSPASLPDEYGSVRVGLGLGDRLGAGRGGRVGVLDVSPRVSDYILEGKTERQLRDLALEEGMTTLHADARTKVLDGLTTIDEMIRVLGR